jgi:hypothetical protein
MEADWEFEVMEGAPVIDALWPGFVDLRNHPESAGDLAESKLLPALAPALAHLNASSSGIWTSKSDVFDPGYVDPDELDATAEESADLLACYIDMLPRREGQWSLPSAIEQDCRRICAALSTQAARCCRVDLVIRRAYSGADTTDLGVTAYLMACGSTELEARVRLTGCLVSFAEVIAASLQSGLRT